LFNGLFHNRKGPFSRNHTMKPSYEQFRELLCQEENGQLIDSFISVELGRDIASAYWEAYIDELEDSSGSLDHVDLSALATDFVLQLTEEINLADIDFTKLTGTRNES